MLKIDSRSLSDVGRIAFEEGLFSVRPRNCPPTIRIQKIPLQVRTCITSPSLSVAVSQLPFPFPPPDRRGRGREGAAVRAWSLPGEELVRMRAGLRRKLLPIIRPRLIRLLPLSRRR